MVSLDGSLGKADMLIPPDNDIGFEIAAVSGRRVTVRQILNTAAAGKTTWEHFVPACFDF